MTSEMNERERRVVECFASEHAAAIKNELLREQEERKRAWEATECLNTELAEARALKQELESDYQRVCRRLAAMTEQRDSLRDKCEGLREQNKMLARIAYPAIRDPIVRKSGGVS